VKKGFTLVELAIVLVIIGLITGMAVKGRSLAAAAEMREEVNKLRKYEHAFATHYAKSGRDIPAYYDSTDPQQWADNVTRIFLKQNYLVPKDLVMKYSTKAVPSTYFVVELVSSAINPDIGYDLDREIANSPTNFGVLLDAGTDRALNYFVCSVEVMYDDRNIFTGYGRVSYSGGGGGTPAVNFEDEEYADCSEFTATETTLYGYVVYSY
jgi:prepilin-type N-terminal cleavage/methylation domain-containing protein